MRQSDPETNAAPPAEEGHVPTRRQVREHIETLIKSERERMAHHLEQRGMPDLAKRIRDDSEDGEIFGWE